MTTTSSPARALPSDQDASGRNLGFQEILAVAQAITSGTLTSTKGTFVNALQSAFALRLGAKYAYACASGTAAIHCAVAAIDPTPGDEIITTAITDMGALTPILYQGAIPVFADVDPRTYNVTAEAIEARITERTKAIIVTHLFGNPAEMDAIVALAQRHNIPVIEDCAQAFDATYDGKRVGTIGTIGCFSLQQGKHITTGEGGIVVTDDANLARRINLFINKAWGYGDPAPDHYFIALNYRMSELCGAVGLAQIEKLDGVVERRIALADTMTSLLSDIPGLETPYILPKAAHTYWKYCIRIDERIIPGGVTALAARLKERNIFTAPRYIQKPAFACEIFQKQRTFGRSSWPFNLATADAVNYSRERFAGTYEALERVLVIPWNDRFTEEDVHYISWALHDAVSLAQSGEETGRG